MITDLPNELLLKVAGDLSYIFLIKENWELWWLKISWLSIFLHCIELPRFSLGSTRLSWAQWCSFASDGLRYRGGSTHSISLNTTKDKAQEGSGIIWLCFLARLVVPAGPSCLFTCCLGTCRGPRWTACLPSPGWSTLVEAFCFHSLFLSQAGKGEATPRDRSPQCILPGNIPADPRGLSQPARDGLESWGTKWEKMAIFGKLNIWTWKYQCKNLFSADEGNSSSSPAQQHRVLDFIHLPMNTHEYTKPTSISWSNFDDGFRSLFEKCFFSPSKSNFQHVSAKANFYLASNETNVNVQSHKNQNPRVDESKAANRRS